MSKRSNILISGDAPSIYLRRIQEQQGLSSGRLDEILQTHLIDPEFLRNDDFEGFFNARLKTLSTLIAGALQKPIIETHGSNETEVDIEADLESALESQSDDVLIA